MTISILRTPKGKLIHATRGNVIPVSGGTSLAEVLCGREFTGPTGEVESPEEVTCPRCQERLLAELAAELSEVEAQMAMHGEPRVLGTPEAVSAPEPPRRRMTAGRYRHGMIRHQRNQRRHQMKGMVRESQDATQR